jgi:hypothetical protein
MRQTINDMRDIGWTFNPNGTLNVFRSATGSVIHPALDIDTPINAHYGVLAQDIRYVIRGAK